MSENEFSQTVSIDFAPRGSVCEWCGKPATQLVPRLPRLFDRTLVLDSRHVAWLELERDCTQHAAHDLATACLGQVTHEVDLPDDHHGTQFVAYSGVQLLHQFLRGLISLSEH